MSSEILDCDLPSFLVFVFFFGGGSVSRQGFSDGSSMKAWAFYYS